MDKYLDVQKWLIQKMEVLTALAQEKLSSYPVLDYAELSIGCIDPVGNLSVFSVPLIVNGVTTPKCSVVNLLNLLYKEEGIGAVEEWSVCRSTVAVALTGAVSNSTNKQISEDLLEHLRTFAL